MPHPELNRASALLGKDILIAQGAGGNTSFKDFNSNALYIKASGKKLKNAESENIFTKIDLNKAVNWLHTNQDIFPQDWHLESDALRPSIETSMHLVFKEKAVFHTHPVDIIFQTLFQKGRDNLNKALERFNFAYIKYVKPGRPLTQEITQHPLFGKTNVFVLENHGLITCGDEIIETLNLTQEVVKSCSQPPREAIALMQFPSHPLPSSLSKSYQWAKSPLIHCLSTDPHLIKLFDVSNNVLYPDQAVFFGSSSHHVNTINEIDSQINEPCIVIRNKGVLINKENNLLIEELLLNHIQILLRLPADIDPHYLPQENINQLINWEAEIFRKQINHE